MLILALDTATRTAGVALMKDGRPYGEIILNNGMTHSVSLLPAVDQLLNNCKTELQEINVIAFANGPGSFTGLRIGGAFVTGLAQANNIPVCPVPTLEALALNAEGFRGVIAPILDARKNEVYTAAFKVEKEEMIKLKVEEALSLDDFCNQFTNPQEVMVLGDAVDKYRALLMQKGFKIPSELLLLPRPMNIASLAYQRMLKGEKFLPYQEIKLSYLRASEAEVKLQQKLGAKHA